MSTNWNDILQLTAATLEGDRRIPKTVITEQARRSKVASRPEPFHEKLRGVRHFATLTKSNSHILPVRDDAYDVESVLFPTMELRAVKATPDAVRMLHGCFPNPTVFLMTDAGGKEISVSVAIRRKNLAERGAFVTEREVATGFFDPSVEPYRVFLERLAYREMPQTTLLEYASAFADRCLAACTVRTLGYYPRYRDTDVDTLISRVKRLHELESSIDELKAARRAKGATLAETSKIRVEISRLEKERDSAAASIKELVV